MDFDQFYTSFNVKIKDLMGLDNVSASDIESMSLMFAQIAKYDLVEHNSVRLKFVKSIYAYFLLIVKYAHPLDKRSPQECQLNVRMALDAFLFVVSKIKAYPHIIIRCLARSFFDQLIEKCGEFGFVQEFLKVYVSCINRVPKSVVESLASIHKNLHLLPNIVKKAHETSIQYVIVALLLKLSYNTETSQLEHMFPEVKDLVAVVVDHEYQKIRMVLEKLNKNSTKIFSINCTSIMLDGHVVPEFEMEKLKNGHWLDVDLSFNRLSFFCFCSPISLSEFTSDKITYGLANELEVVSFKAEDCLETTFTCSNDYKGLPKYLEIYIKIFMTKVNVFQKVKPDQIINLVFKIPYSEKYDIFVKITLPRIFPNFSEENIVHTYEERVTPRNIRSFDYYEPLEEEDFELSDVSSTIESRYDMLFRSIAAVKKDEDEIQEHVQAATLATYKIVKLSTSTSVKQELEIKDEPSSPSTKKAPAAKSGSKKEVRELHVKTELTLGKVIAAPKSSVREYQQQDKIQKLIDKSSDKSQKTCGKKMVVVSSPQSSSKPSRVPVETPLSRGKKSITAGQSSTKLLKTPASKSGSKKEVRDLHVKTELTLGKVIAAPKTGVREYQQEDKIQKLIDKSSDKSQKTCGKKMVVVSSPQSSSEPFRFPVETPLSGGKKSITSGQSSTKLLKTPAAKSGSKKEVKDHHVKTELTFGKVIAAPKSSVRKYKQEDNIQKLTDKSSDKSQKTCGKKMVVVSSPSTHSSPQPFRFPVETPLSGGKRSITAGESSAKRLKLNEGATNSSIKDTSNVVIKEANILQPKPTNEEFNISLENLSPCYCCMLTKNKNCPLLDLISKHVKTCNK